MTSFVVQGKSLFVVGNKKFRAPARKTKRLVPLGLDFGASTVVQRNDNNLQSRIESRVGSNDKVRKMQSHASRRLARRFTRSKPRDS